MEEITVNIGSIETGNSGIANDTRQEVVFTGEELGEYREYGHDRHGNITDTRGVTETLYRAADGRLVVHTNAWSRWSGEPNTERLIVVTEADLQPNARFALLGAACGFGRPLTLDEAIGPATEEELPGMRETSSGDFWDKEEEELRTRIDANRARLEELMGGEIDPEAGEQSGIVCSLFDDMTAIDVQHSIAIFADALIGLGWHEQNEVIRRLVDALLGVLDDDYFDALEAGRFDAPD